MKILLFGTGKVYQRYRHLFFGHEIIYLLDNDVNKQGDSLDGIEIVSPDKGINVSYEAVFILSVFFEEMKAQLIALGVDEGRIYSCWEADVCMSQAPVIYGDMSFLEETEGAGRILILTHNMRTTGAEVVLFEAAKILKRNGFEVLVTAQEDGTMRQAFVNAGIPVIIDVGVSVYKLISMPLIKKFHPTMVMVNTVYMHHVFKGGLLEIPVIWWLHDSEALYVWGQCEGLDSYYHDNVSVYAVSKIAREPFSARCPSWPVGLLPYGIKDIEIIKNNKFDNNKLVFATVGALEEHKGQDILFEAIDLLPEMERRKCEFWLIYQPVTPSEYANKIMEKSALLPEVKMLGQIVHENMGDVYENISALICPSTSDTLPAVTVEAMQYARPCIVSDGTGTADYIEDFKNGFVCSKGDSSALAEKILWMIANKDKLPSIGKEARKIYEKYFSLEVFEKNLMDIFGQY